MDYKRLGERIREEHLRLNLTQAQLAEAIDISESTLYPVLRRLQKDQALESYDRAYQGRNRRYYRITESGRQHCRTLSEEWNTYRDTVDQIVKTGGVQHE